MKKLRKISKDYYLRKIVACWLIFCMLVIMPARVAMAATPICTDDGGATVTQGTDFTNVLVDQTETIMKWSNFNTVDNELVAFEQGALINSAVLNKISGGQTQFNGDLTGVGMRIFLINPAGIVFSSTSSVNVNQLVASSLEIEDGDFLNGMPYTFTGGADAKNVTNNGEITAETIALIGRNVINTGALSAESGLVIMAAGDSVLISETGGSVAVEALMPTQTGAYDYTVTHGDEVSGDGSIEAQDVILAAGDIWSYAYISAQGQDSASVTMDAEGYGNVVIDDEVEITATADGTGTDNTASITILAGGNVTAVNTGDDDTIIRAQASNGSTNTANVKIDADGLVELRSENDNVRVQAWAGPDPDDKIEVPLSNLNKATIEIDAADVLVQSNYNDVQVTAEASYAIKNIAEVKIRVDNDVKVIADYNQEARIQAFAYDGSTNTANVEINAGGNVEVDSRYGGEYGEAFIMAGAYDGETNKANVKISTTGEADGDSDVKVTSNGEEGYAGIIAEAMNGNTNTAGVEINAAGGVVVKATNGGEAEIIAYADPDVESIPTAINTANVVINSVDDVEVVANNCPDDDEGGTWDAAIAAWATEGKINTSNITIDAGGDVKVTSKYTGSSAAIDAAAWNDEITVGHEDVLDGLVNTAKVDVTAESVLVRSDLGGASIMSAYAMNEIVLNGSVDRGDDVYVADITLGSIKNDADIVITTTNDDDGGTIEESIYVADKGDVLALDIGGAEEGGGGIDAEAFNVIRYDDYYDVDLTIQGPIVNSADILINAADDVSVIANSGLSYGDTEIDSEAWNDVVGDSAYYINLIEEGSVVNSAGVDVTAGDDVIVIAECGDPRTWAALAAHAWNYSEAYLPGSFPDIKTNTATVAIDAGGDVIVKGVNGGTAGIEAGTEFAVDNTALVDIDALGGVYVSDQGDNEGEHYYSGIRAYAWTAVNSNTADVKIDAGKVKVFAEEGGNAAITADAALAIGDTSTNSADVTIYTHAVVEEPVEEPSEPTVTAVTLENGEDDYDGSVLVKAEEDSKAQINAIAGDAYANTADVLLCTEGGVTVESNYGGAEILAEAFYGYSNTATVGMGVASEDGVLVRSSGSDYSDYAFIESRAHDGYSDTAETVVCTTGDIIVLDEGGVAYTAGILSEATGGIETDAYVGVCAEGDVIVAAGLTLDELESGYVSDVYRDGHALIKAMATPYGENSVRVSDVPITEPTSANAETVVISRTGNVEVKAYNGGSAEILADAYGAHANTADVGVAAGAVLSPADVIVEPDLPVINGDSLVDNGVVLPEAGNVIVEAHGKGSEAQILAYAHNAADLEIPVEPVVRDTEPLMEIVPGQNTADTVVCAPGFVKVLADEGSEARIKSKAGWWEDGDSINIAKTQIYATDVIVDVYSLYHGQGIWAYAYGLEDKPHVPAIFLMTLDGEFVQIEEDDESDSVATLLVMDYSEAQDCPDCPGCPCGEAPPLLAPVAPLPEFDLPRIEGCPALTLAAAAELGIPEEALQVGIGNALALNPTIQPCQACASLVNAAAILRDEDGSRMAAMVQTFNALAPADTPFSPEMATSITMALGDAAEGTQYASVAEYIDAFVQYVAALDTGLGTPVGDSVAYVLEKYGAGITDSENSNIAAFVATRLEAIGG